MFEVEQGVLSFVLHSSSTSAFLSFPLSFSFCLRFSRNHHHHTHQLSVSSSSLPLLLKMSPIATSAPTDETSTITQKLAYLLTPSKEEVIRYGTAEHPYSTLPETTEDLPWADLITLELSKFDEPGGKQFLANQLKEAVKLTG